MRWAAHAWTRGNAMAICTKEALARSDHVRNSDNSTLVMKAAQKSTQQQMYALTRSHIKTLLQEPCLCPRNAKAEQARLPPTIASRLTPRALEVGRYEVSR